MFLGKIYHSIAVGLLLFSSLLNSADANLSTEVFDCVISPSNVSDLGSNARGVITHIFVDRNDFVKKGDEIAILDDKVEQAIVVLSQKQASSESEIVLSNLKLTYALSEQEHAQKAFKEKAFSLHDFDKAKVETELAKIKLLQAQEQKRLAESKLQEAQARLEHRTIYAPFSGVVMERFKTIGEFIDDDPVVRLAQLDPLYAELIVPVAQKDTIKKGMQAKVCTDKNAGKGWNVTVDQVDEVIDAASGTFGVRLLLPNPEYKIPAGLRCDLKFILSNVSVTKEGVMSRD